VKGEIADSCLRPYGEVGSGEGKMEIGETRKKKNENGGVYEDSI